MRRTSQGRTARRGTCARVSPMFAHSTQNWWWTAHPAAH
ncbi:trp operon leader peptide [Streptomyces sp. YC504]|uniref:Trp operon leader peptide n=1 Tax=Streptomyces mesophilus TaxID=1775132 RepID=A0A6G4XJV1_9ACTN|nr:trp operon leader peptide [Streptomyces mesophilus]